MDPETYRAWGPFKDEVDAKLFYGKAVYLRDWAIVLSPEDLLWYKNHTLAHPSEYSPGMAKLFPKDSYIFEVYNDE